MVLKLMLQYQNDVISPSTTNGEITTAALKEGVNLFWHDFCCVIRIRDTIRIVTLTCFDFLILFPLYSVVMTVLTNIRNAPIDYPIWNINDWTVIHNLVTLK